MQIYAANAALENDMHRNEHTRCHKQLDEALNTLVADFIEYSDIPPHLATVHHLLTWSKEQAKDADHPNTKGRHEAPNAEVTGRASAACGGPR